MIEIWVPLALVTVFLFLHIIRPHVKKFKTIDGLAWLPLISLVSIIMLIPAYGLRPETIPLLIFTAVLTLIIIFKQLNGDIKFRSFRQKSILSVFSPLFILAASSGIAFYFTPIEDLSINTQGIYSLTIDNYNIRVYTDENDSMPQNRPLLVVLPPELGSFRVIDKTADQLRDLGFTVLVCERNKDLGFVELLRRAGVFFRGNVSAATNKKGRELEEKRKEDAQFILSWVRRDRWLNGSVRIFHLASKDAVYFAGYDTGGSALILLEDSMTGTEEITIRGLIAIESPLWSLYREETRPVQKLPANAGWFQSVRVGTKNWSQDIKPKKIIGLEQMPELSVPVLFLVSDWSREPKFAKSRYQALMKCFSDAKSLAVLVSADGAGPLDYTDFPVRYPIVTFLVKGRGTPTWNNIEAPKQTAAIINNFAGSVFVSEEGDVWPLGQSDSLTGVQTKVNRK